MSIYVHPQHTGKGVGTTLFEKAKNKLIKQNQRVIFSKVKVNNADSIAFYKAMAFKEKSKNGNIIWCKYLL